MEGGERWWDEGKQSALYAWIKSSKDKCIKKQFYDILHPSMQIRLLGRIANQWFEEFCANSLRSQNNMISTFAETGE